MTLKIKKILQNWHYYLKHTRNFNCTTDSVFMILQTSIFPCQYVHSVCYKKQQNFKTYCQHKMSLIWRGWVMWDYFSCLPKSTTRECKMALKVTISFVCQEVPVIATRWCGQTWYVCLATWISNMWCRPLLTTCIMLWKDQTLVLRDKGLFAPSEPCHTLNMTDWKNTHLKYEFLFLPPFDSKSFLIN